MIGAWLNAIRLSVTPRRLMPRAFVGINWQFKPPAVRICAACADKPKCESLAARAGLDQTHTLCTVHYQKVMSEIASLRRA